MQITYAFRGTITVFYDCRLFRYFVPGEKQKRRHMSKIKDIPPEERPCEKCFLKGPEALTDSELLSVILRTGTGGMNVLELANQIMALDGSHSLLSVMHLTKEQLMEIRGIGKVKSVQLLCICELVKRITRQNAAPSLKFDSPALIARYYMESMRHLAGTSGCIISGHKMPPQERNIHFKRYGKSVFSVAQRNFYRSPAVQCSQYCIDTQSSKW